MKKIITLFSVFVFGLNVNAQTPTWQWAKSAGGSGNDPGSSICIDANGNTYVTGSYASSSITFGSTTFTNTGGIDFYIVKYNPSGNVLWAKSASGVSNDVGYNIAVDANGNAYVVGTFNSSSVTFGSTVLTLNAFDDIFIVKYDSSGNLLWAKRAGGSANDIGQNISLDNKGNAYITGYFASSSILFGGITLTNSGGNDIYVTKYDAAGNVVWAKSAAGTGNESGLGIAVDAGKNIYATGYFLSSSLAFGSSTLNNTGGDDFFIVKYDSLGNALWAKSASGVSNDVGYNLAVDASGNPYVVGTFNSSSVTFGSTVLTLNAFDDIFIVKYNTSGTLLWAKKAGGNANDIGQNIALDNNGNAYITGYFASASILFGSTTLTNVGGNDLYVTKYDASGNAMWAVSAGGSGNDAGNGICMDANGNAYITGTFASASLTLSTSLTNAGAIDMFAAKLGGFVGIKEESNQAATITALPNPNNGLFSIQINDIHHSNFKTHIVVVDMLGKEVYNSLLAAQSATYNIDLSDQANGMYYVIVSNNDKQCKSKIVVNK